jgi:hypothetical protein
VDPKPLKEMIQKERIKALNDKGIKKGVYVLYWHESPEKGSLFLQ